MSEWSVVLVFLLLALIAGIGLIYPLRRSSLSWIVVLPLVVTVTLSGYFYWGSFFSWQGHQKQIASEERARELLKSIKSPQQLITQLKAKLDDTPKSARGWYLLGRLYLAQNELQNAVDSFAKAYAFEIDNELYAVNYAQSLWQLNQQHFNEQIITVLNHVLINNPRQTDTLAMLAMNAFISNSYAEAVSYWQRLLELLPEQSPESMAVRKAIAKAQARITIKRE